MPVHTDQSEVLAGLVERVTFHNEENGFCVLRVKARGHKDLVTAVGHAATITAGEWLTASGTWHHDRTHGLQFRAKFLKTSAPSTLEGIEKYLASGMIRGIGPVYAKRLILAFRDKVFEVIETAPGRLREVEGIGVLRAERIMAAWAEQKIVREIMLFLHSHGVGTSRAVRIYKTYGNDAVQVMSENPYRLAKDIRGIGFKTADAIAERLGIEKTAMIRVRAGISFALAEAQSEGHCGLPAEDLCSLAEKLLEVPSDLIETAIALELQEGVLVKDRIEDRDCVFLAGLYQAEKAIGERLSQIARGKPAWPAIETAKAIPWIETKIGFTLAESQKEAVGLALASKALVITGGPGTGKTTIVNAILKILKAKDVSMLLCAPTGRAAKRMTETTGLEAKTIHRLLEADPKRGGFLKDQDNPLETDLLVIDEASMVDVPLMHALLKALPNRAALLIVGDIDQLPSVGPGQVLADVIELGGGSGDPLDRGVPASGREPHHHRRASHQQGRAAKPRKAARRERFPLCAGGRARGGDGQDFGPRARTHPQKVRARCHSRHSGSLPHEQGRSWRPVTQSRTAKGAQSARRRKARQVRMDLLPQR